MHAGCIILLIIVNTRIRAEMTSKSDSPVYAEANEAFEMERNRCYSTVITSSSNREKSSSNRHDYFIAIVVLISATLLVLAATSACAIIALVQNSKLDGRITSLSANTEFSHKNNSLDENILELRHNYSQLLNIVTYFNSNFEELMQNFSQLYTQLKTESKCLPSTTACSNLAPSCPSGYYLIMASNGTTVQVYCDMTLSCGNITGGWMRVAELNMTDTSQQCPSDLMEINDNNIRRCEVTNKGCSSITYNNQHKTAILKYVAELQPTRLVPLMHFDNITKTKVLPPSTPPMWMVLVSLMETQESTSGRLQLLWTETTI